MIKPSKPADGPLREALRSWELRTPLPPGFEDGVWRRVQGVEDRADPIGNTGRIWSGLGAWLQALVRNLVRPAWATAYVGTILAVALLLGHWQAQERSAAWRSLQAQKYLQSLDPYQSTRTSP